MQLIQKSPEVFLAEGEISAIGKNEIDLMKSAVTKTPLGRVRINLHPSNEDTLHEMFIVIQRDSYIRVHKHLNKSEAFHMVYGAARVVVFNNDGSIKQVVPLAANCPDIPFYYRMSKPFYHTLIIESDIIVVHEITNGPFVPGGTVYADFSPEEKDRVAVANFQMSLKNQLKNMELQ